MLCGWSQNTSNYIKPNIRQILTNWMSKWFSSLNCFESVNPLWIGNKVICLLYQLCVDLLLWLCLSINVNKGIPGTDCKQYTTLICYSLPRKCDCSTAKESYLLTKWRVIIGRLTILRTLLCWLDLQITNDDCIRGRK